MAPLRGIYIFKVATVEEARALTATDPAIQAGRLEMELHPWYGSAALQQLNALHKRIQRKSFGESRPTGANIAARRTDSIHRRCL